MKKRVVIATIGCMLLLGACGKETVKEDTSKPATEQAQETTVAEAADAESMIEKVLTTAGADRSDVHDYKIADFDGDKAAEAFVYVGTEVDPEWSTCSGAVWFVDGDTCESVIELEIFYVDGEDVISTVDVGERIYAHVREEYTTSLVSYLYYVEDNRIQESCISGRGSFFEPDYVDGYGISLSAYDGMVDYEVGAEDEGMYTGHTWKHYYFYYDAAAGDFAEYVGTPISERELAEACGEDLAGAIRDAGYEVGEIYKRDNGIINVNYSKTTENDGAINVEYHNATYNMNTKQYADPWDAGTNTWEGSDFGGTYLAGITT